MKQFMFVLVMILPTAIAAQELHTFSNGEVADAEKINENFQYVLENATGSGGCSAEQDGSSVVITCADGTTGVLASEGTVVVYPEGGIVGDSPVQSWPTGSIVFVDDNDIVLAEAIESMNNTIFYMGGFRGTFVNRDESVLVTGWGGGGDLYYLTDDCTGQEFGTYPSLLYDTPDGLAVADISTNEDQILSNSQRKSGHGRFPDSYSPIGTCTTVQSVVNARPLIDYTPSEEIINAVYPVRLNQLP